ncbi:phospholipase [Pokkaliibacter plantistimulans]|uniref:Phospholipase n=1 Tax=Proteobacteria bacterium 228 TaxID=2083153 RepID=A0A2S5KX07_9PROT|nr:phospholipase [Pokkaliibacter plantistimulans]PPC78806.1 phospholipase [Pokkaliibacter plantistimulans]
MGFFSSAAALTTDPASGLQYRVAPRTSSAPARARLLLLHGVGGNEGNFDGIAEQLDPELEVVQVRGPLTLAAGQYAWFMVSFQTGSPVINAEQANTSRQQLISLIASLQSTRSLPTVIAGFSQGGIMSAGVALTSPASVSGFGLLSGRILPEIEPLLADSAALASVRGFIAHGEFDNKLPVDWAHKATAWLERLGVAHQVRLYPMGHELNRQVVADFAGWLQTLLG